MVSDQYHVNDRAMSDEVMSENGKKVRDIKASISSPIPTEDVANVLEYFGITTATVPNEHMENKYRMQAHARLSAVLKSNGSSQLDDELINNQILFRVPRRIHQGSGGDRSSTASSFSAWRSNCRNPIYPSHDRDDYWPRIEYWWNNLKWPTVFLLICTILGLFIYFLVVEMEINASLINTDKVIESNIFLREMDYQEMSKNTSWSAADEYLNRNSFSGTPINNTIAGQRPNHTQVMYGDNASSGSKETSPESTTAGSTQYGFTSGHQNNFGIPIEEDERILNRLNDELIRLQNETTTQRLSTTTSDQYRTKVSPTLPLIHKSLDSTTEKLNVSNHRVNEKCVSTSLPLCRGVLHYDLTNENSPGMTTEETILFKYLMDTRCSSRAAQFLCTLFEPECGPLVSGALPPCKRFCKSVLEPCSQAVANSELLTELFDCDIYPESHDPNVCIDPTRYSKCLKNEFKCRDATCIPQRWRCDNIIDCASGDDEENCKFCEQDEFKCMENDKCIPADWRCDQFKDCPGGSDELDCIDDESRSFPLGYGTPGRTHSFVHELSPNADIHQRPYQRLNEEERRDRAPVADQEHATSNVQRQILASKSLTNFQDSTEIMITSDSENKLKYAEDKRATAHNSPCPQGELRCLSGRCISLSQLCDTVIDCADGSDEAMCSTTMLNRQQVKVTTN